MLKREYDALVAANGDTPKKPAGEPERAPVVSEEEVEKTVNNSADATDDHIVSARLVGSKRHKEARARLKHGTSLHLRRDEANKHDPNAIAVDVTAGFLPIHAGFVKGTQAESLAPALDSGALTVVACTVDAPNGVDSLPTADVPVRLTLRRRDDGDASATSATRPRRRPSSYSNAHSTSRARSGFCRRTSSRTRSPSRCPLTRGSRTMRAPNPPSSLR